MHNFISQFPRPITTFMTCLVGDMSDLVGKKCCLGGASNISVICLVRQKGDGLFGWNHVPEKFNKENMFCCKYTTSISFA